MEVGNILAIILASANLIPPENPMQSTTETKNIPGRITYDCHLYTGNVVGLERGVVEASIRYLPDGRKLTQKIEYRSGSSAGNNRFEISWLAHGSDSMGRVIGWADANILMSHSSLKNITDRLDYENGAWQVVVAKKDFMKTFAYKGNRYLDPQWPDLALASEGGPQTTDIELNISLDDLKSLQNATALTVYEALVHTEKLPDEDSPPSFGYRRILASYDIDMPVIRDAISSTKEVIDKWEASLANKQTQCPRRVEEDFRNIQSGWALERR